MCMQVQRESFIISDGKKNGKFKAEIFQLIFTIACKITFLKIHLFLHGDLKKLWVIWRISKRGDNMWDKVHSNHAVTMLKIPKVIPVYMFMRARHDDNIFLGNCIVHYLERRWYVMKSLTLDVCLMSKSKSLVIKKWFLTLNFSALSFLANEKISS